MKRSTVFLFVFAGCTPFFARAQRIPRRTPSAVQLAAQARETGFEAAIETKAPEFFTLSLQYKVRQRAVEGAISAFTPALNGQRFAKCRRMGVMIDGYQTTIPVRYRSTRMSGAFAETVSFDIPPLNPALIEIIQQVYCDLCGTRFIIDEPTVRGIQTFLTRVMWLREARPQQAPVPRLGPN